MSMLDSARPSPSRHLGLAAILFFIAATLSGIVVTPEAAAATPAATDGSLLTDAPATPGPPSPPNAPAQRR